MNYITEYYNQIASGEILACKKILNVYKHLAEKCAGNIQDGYHFDEYKADRIIEFIEKFCHLSKGANAGELVKLQLWQKAFLQSIFGFVDNDGRRQYKEVFLLIGRKNSKSTMAAFIALYILLTSKDAPEIYTLGTKRDQAKIVWTECVNIIKKSSSLRRYCKCRVGDIYTEFNAGILKPLASDSSTLDGVNSSLVVIDELHQLQDANLYNVMKDSQSARQEPLLLITTTNGTVRQNIFDDKYKQAEATLEGYQGGSYVDHRFLPICYELDNRNEWEDSKNYIKANPGLSVIKSYIDLAEKCQRAKGGHENLANLLTKEFNIAASSSYSFLMWDDIKHTTDFNIKEILKEETYCIWGVDLSRTTDLSAATCIFKLASYPDKIYCTSMSWITEEALENNNESKIPYKKWLDSGWLRVCNGNIINYKDIVEYIEEVKENFGLYPFKICYDRYSATYFIQDLEQYGKDCLVPVAQGAKTLNIPLEYLEQQIKQHNIVYQNNPCLMWQLANMRVKVNNNGGKQPDKNRNLELRDDAGMALVDAIKGLLDFNAEYEIMIDSKN